MTTALRAADRLFRIAGIVTIAGLVVALGMRLAGSATWWVPFVAAHLGALIALLPLGVVLVVRAVREAGGLLPAVTRHAAVTIALLVIAGSVTTTLLEFSANPGVRRVSNFLTVALVLLLVARYLQWSRRYATDSEAGSSTRSGS